MSATQLVYGDGWQDIKDCFHGSLGLGRGRASSRTSSRGGGGGGRVYGGGGDYGGYSSSNDGCCDGDCLGDLGEKCTKTRLGISILFLWVVILTIVCIVLGSNIAYSSNATLSSRLDDHSNQHDHKMSSHSRLLNDLNSSHDRTAGRVETVANQVGRLRNDVTQVEGRLRTEIRGKLSDVRSVLLAALDKANKSLQDIKEDVKKGIV